MLSNQSNASAALLRNHSEVAEEEICQDFFITNHDKFITSNNQKLKKCVRCVKLLRNDD